MTKYVDLKVATNHPSDSLRREFLLQVVPGIVGVWLVGSSPLLGADGQANPSNNGPPGSFMDIARVLTGHMIDPDLGDTAWQALVAHERNFATRFSELLNAVQKAVLTNGQAFDAGAAFPDGPLKATAVAVVGAFYLGRVGKVSPRSTDGPQFITYSGALMWRPTLDVTILPTYARGGPGSWAVKPSTVASD